MSGKGLFPQQDDGGIAPNPEDLSNPTQAFVPTTAATQPVDTTALYWGNGCDIALRPHVGNSILSELLATFDRAGLAYKTTSLQNLETAIRYLIQRGLPRAERMYTADAVHFTVTLDPPATHYNDLMTLTLLPHLPNNPAGNAGAVRINVNDLGWVPLLRNDGSEMAAGELRHDRPLIAIAVNCVFYRDH